MADRKLGDILVERGVLPHEQLEKALAEQQISGQKLGDILVSLGFATEEDVVSVLSEQMGLAYIDLNAYQIEPEVLELIDQKTAHQYKALPLFKIDNTLTVALVDPLELQSVDELNGITNLEVQPVFGTRTAILKALDRYYGKSSALNDAIADFQDSDSSDDSQTETTKNRTVKVEESEADAPAIKLVNLIFSEALRDGASDIHFEPGEDVFNIRCRVDGVLYGLTPPPNSLQNAILSRLKVIANLDIAEKRLPQDGRVQLDINDKRVDLRVSTFPTIHGENVVIRILDTSSGILSLDRLGMNEKMLKESIELVQRPNGIILVTGPTGSGKTTTLYAFLSSINSEDKNIMTMEDPVEYRIQGIRQANVDVKSGLTFQGGLRSIMRQDPDVIMIGEIRDKETAEISIQSALTGHLVLSTLHTNDSASTIARLIDMGIEPFLISTSINGVLSQRLIRKLCDACKKSYTPPESLLSDLGLSPGDYTFYEETGCDDCRKTGFKGRMGIYELFIPTPEIKQMINNKPTSGELEKAARQTGFVNLRQDALNRVTAGTTSVSELLRLT